MFNVAQAMEIGDSHLPSLQRRYAFLTSYGITHFYQLANTFWDWHAHGERKEQAIIGLT